MTLSSQPPLLFPHFSNLPSELRLKIWQRACPNRTVSVRYIPESDVCLSPARPPALLQTCRESRAEALRTYTLSFETRSSPARIYFSPDRDTLYFPRHRMMGYDETLRDFRDCLKEGEMEVLDEVRSVAIDHVDAAVKRPWEAYNKASLLRGFPALREVVLVLREKGTKPCLGNGHELEESREQPEDLLRIWVQFRQSIVMEEKVLEDVCKAMGTEYTKWTLPTVRFKARSNL